jgi:hypothetical protein
MPDRSFLFINVEPRTVLSYFVAYRFLGFCRRRRPPAGSRNVCDEQYTERASLPIIFLIKQLRVYHRIASAFTPSPGVQFRDSCCNLRQA